MFHKKVRFLVIMSILMVIVGCVAFTAKAQELPPHGANGAGDADVKVAATLDPKNATIAAQAEYIKYLKAKVAILETRVSKLEPFAAMAWQPLMDTQNQLQQLDAKKPAEPPALQPKQ